MPAINLGTFNGMMPRVADHLLDESYSSYALNCNYDHGTLQAHKGNLPVSALIYSTSKTIYLYNHQYWMSWQSDVDVVKSSVPFDQYQRIYFTGTDLPRYTYQSIAIGAAEIPEASRPLGIEAPTGQITASTTYIDDGSTEDDESRYYIFTLVNDLGEEGAPSPPSNLVTVNKDGRPTTLTLPTITNNNRGYLKKRIYRSATTGDSADWLFVADVGINVTSYVDSKYNYALGSALATDLYYPPPSDMQGITVLENGVIAGFSENVFCPSEPYLGYAFNPNNQLSCESNIVAIAQVPNGAVILTEAQPYLLQGMNPESYNMLKLETTAPCVSAKSVVDVGQGVLYASSEGVMQIGNGEPQLVSSNAFTKEQWQALNPETAIAARWEDKYICVTDNSAFCLDGQSGTVTWLNLNVDCFHRDEYTENLYFVNNGQLYQFAGDTELQAEWTSKEYRTPPTSFNMIKVYGENMSVTLCRNGLDIFTINCNGSYDQFARLPSGLGSSWYVKATGDGELKTVSIATSTEELI